MHMVQHWLTVVPPALAYLIVGLIIAVESMGIPLPGEIALVSASLLAATGAIDIWWVAIAASAGAIVGDSIGYAIGRRGGRPLLARLGRRFPKHLGPAQVARAERAFDRFGVWAIFFGRFVALLRVLAGPLAGALRVPYPRFLAANAAGGIVWAGGTSLVIYSIGQAAERWLASFSWVALGVAVLCGIGTTLFLRSRAHRSTAGADDNSADHTDPDGAGPAGADTSGPDHAGQDGSDRDPDDTAGAAGSGPDLTGNAAAAGDDQDPTTAGAAGFAADRPDRADLSTRANWSPEPATAQAGEAATAGA